MTRELIEDVIGREAGLTVIPSPERLAVPEAAESGSADVVIVGRDDQRLARTLLYRRPRLRMLAVVSDGRDSLLYELRPHREELGELSPDVLLGALRRRREGADWSPATS